MFALAQLAADRFRSVKDPVEYFTQDISPRRRAIIWAILVLLTNAFDVVAQLEIIKSNIYIYTMIFPLPQFIRSVYLFATFYKYAYQCIQ